MTAVVIPSNMALLIHKHPSSLGLGHL